MSCGHSLCDICVRIFGRPIGEVEYTYTLDECIFCALGSLEVAIMPPTAAGCLLSIDGGGTRGVATLEFLGIL